jgi:hypothetical protein
MSQGSL